MPVSLVREIDDEVTNKRYPDRSEAIRTKLQNSKHYDELLEITKNPEFEKELSDKIQLLLSKSDVKKTLEKMSIKERNALAVYIKVLNDITLTQSKLVG